MSCLVKLSQSLPQRRNKSLGSLCAVSGSVPLGSVSVAIAQVFPGIQGHISLPSHPLSPKWIYWVTTTLVTLWPSSEPETPPMQTSRLPLMETWSVKIPILGPSSDLSDDISSVIPKQSHPNYYAETQYWSSEEEEEKTGESDDEPTEEREGQKARPPTYFAEDPWLPYDAALIEVIGRTEVKDLSSLLTTIRCIVVPAS